MNMNKNIVIWGAGKIGRGFIGDLFDAAGYQIIFADIELDMITKLREQGYYTIYHLKSEVEQKKRVISGYKVLHIDDTNEVHKALMETSLLAVSLFPAAFEETAERIANHIEYRMTKSNAVPLNILICANIIHPASLLSELILQRLSENGKQYFETSVGLIETIVIRMAVTPKKRMLEEDPLVIMTNGYEELTVDKNGFVTDIPDVQGIRITDKIEAEEIRKMYTYNMIHAVFAYTGKIYGLRTIADALENKTVMQIAHGALSEISEALISGFKFTKKQMDNWNEEVIQNMSNPILGDTISRVGSDPKRKLAVNERLVGPADICRQQGIMPYYLATAIACAYLYDNPEDVSSIEIQDYLSFYPIEKAVAYYSGLQNKPDLTVAIKKAYNRISLEGLDFILSENKKIELLKKAYSLGFNSEKTIRGCAQCTIKALGELVSNPQELIFKAASGFSGGIAITGDGSCGGYTGGVLFMGSYIGRKLDRLEDGDKQAQYMSFDMAQKLHDRFIETYGSVTCSEIHKTLFGRDYCLRTKAMRNEFELAGGHADKCTSVIANAASWTAEILLDYNLILMDFNKNR